MVPNALLAGLLFSVGVRAHMSIWTPAMFGFDGPTGCETTEGCFPGQDQVNPMRDLEFDDWWYRGPLYRSALPDKSKVAVLPAGGTWSAEMSCHKDYTSFSSDTSKIPAAGSEQECCPGSPGLYHAHDDSNNLDKSEVGGCALGIADVTDPDDSSIDGDNPIVIFSVQANCVWTRNTTFSIPANMPACSNDYCVCSWHWIAKQDNPNSYMSGFLCKIDGASSTVKWDEPQDATWCGDDSSSCVKGAKRPLYAYNNPNNIPFWDSTNPNAKRPGYSDACGFSDGAQDDIFGGSSSPDSSPKQSFGATPKSSASQAVSASVNTAHPSSLSAARSVSSSHLLAPSSGSYTAASASTDSSSSYEVSPLLLVGGGILVLFLVIGVAVALAHRRHPAGPVDPDEEKKALTREKGSRRRGSSGTASSSLESSSSSDSEDERRRRVRR